MPEYWLTLMFLLKVSLGTFVGKMFHGCSSVTQRIQYYHSWWNLTLIVGHWHRGKGGLTTSSVELDLSLKMLLAVSKVGGESFWRGMTQACIIWYSWWQPAVLCTIFAKYMVIALMKVGRWSQVMTPMCDQEHHQQLQAPLLMGMTSVKL